MSALDATDTDMVSGTPVEVELVEVDDVDDVT